MPKSEITLHCNSLRFLLLAHSWKETTGLALPGYGYHLGPTNIASMLRIALLHEPIISGGRRMCTIRE